MDFKITKTDHASEIISELMGKASRALTACGIAGESNAKIEITEMGAVDTGNLRNSIANTTDDKMAYIGTNVEYAPFIEYGSSRNPNPRPFLQNAVEYHSDEYHEIIESIMRG